MVIGIVGVGAKSVNLLNAMGNSVDTVRPLSVVPPFLIKGNVRLPEDQLVEPASRNHGPAAARALMSAIDESYSGVVVCVDLTGSAIQREFQRDVAVTFTENFRNMHPDKMLHVLPILPDPREESLKDDVVDTCIELQNHADSVVLHHTGLWDDEAEPQDDDTIYPSLATRLRELYAYAARDKKSLRDVSWVAANGGMAIGYEQGEVSQTRKLVRKQPVLETDLSPLIHRATHGRLTAPIDIGSSNRGLVVVRTPPSAVDVEEIQTAVDELVAETAIDTVRVGIQEDAACDDVHALAVLAEGGVRYEAAAIAEEIRELDVEDFQ